MHRGNESIASLRNGFDETRVACLPEGLPEHGDGAIEVGFLDDGVVPDLLQQPFLVDEVPGVLDEDMKEIEDPGRERHRLAVARQPVFDRIE
jgi:hypothetical protein